MLPTNSDHSGSVRAPRHAAPEEDAETTGRHRRPESLADITPRGSGSPRRSQEPAPAAPSDQTRPADQTHPADEVIQRARRAAGRLQYAAESAARQRFPGTRPQTRTGRSRRATGAPSEYLPRPRRAGSTAPEHTRRASRSPASRHAADRRGRHAMPAEQDPLNITVKPITLGAVRDWALDTGGRPPATGSHRAPGTLPVESWLLIGKSRQQALLAGLVAAGLALVMLPTAVQRNDEVNPVTAAGRRAATAAPSPAAPAERDQGRDTGDDGEPARPTKPAAPEATRPARPAEPAPSGAPTTPAEAPIIAVPPGDGPHQSLRTTGSQAIALTFDDGPDPVQTPKILALLEQYQVTATFCVVGTQVERHPEIVRQIVAAGHTLCNHSWDHSLVIGRAEPRDIEADLARTNDAIRRAVPDARIPFFRAPGGNFTDRLVQVAYAGGMTSLYWDVDPRDWEHRPDEEDVKHVEQVIADVQKFVQPGSIVLSHDFNQPDTVEAYQRLLPYLTANFTLGIPQQQPPADS